MEKQGNLLLRLVGAWQRRHEAEIEEQQEDEEDGEEEEEEEEEENHGKVVKRPLVCTFHVIIP